MNTNTNFFFSCSKLGINRCTTVTNKREPIDMSKVCSEIGKVLKIVKLVKKIVVFAKKNNNLHFQCQ